MDVVTTKQLSLFQQKLLDTTRQGTLTEGDVERIRGEGPNLVEVTTRKFFQAIVKSASYTHAVRMVDAILSFAIYQGAVDGESLKNLPLVENLKRGIACLREIDELSIVSTFPPEPSHDNNESTRLKRLAEGVASHKYTPNGLLLELVQEKEIRKSVQSLVDFTEYIVRLRLGSHYNAMVLGEFWDHDNGSAILIPEPCEFIVHSYLFSLVYDLEAGYRLTARLIKQSAEQKRPTIQEVEAKLKRHKVHIPGQFEKEYEQAVTRFIKNGHMKSFFSRKASTRVLFPEEGLLYCLKEI